MLFTTLEYAAFFAIVLTIHWLIPSPLRRPWLLIASYYFYIQTFAMYGWLIGSLTALNYLLALAIAHSSAPRRRAILILGISANLGTLAVFKYLTFALHSLHRFLPDIPNGSLLRIVLPLGISFFAFEFIHYLVEVYKGQAPIRNPIDFALFAAFFPTQIAGPIKRFPDWVKQLQHPVTLREVRSGDGVRYIIQGMVKKIVVADVLATVVTQGYQHPARLGFVTSWLVIYAFAAQIYADFSGYTDIGRGCALLLGYSVPPNFEYPYQSRNPSEFWRRWHISLSSWLRDYLFIPLGGSRVVEWRTALNLMITMALGGLWHGASWHFMLWGIYQGMLLVLHREWDRWRKVWPIAHRRWLESPLWILWSQVLTFHLVCLGWVIFRADSVHGALILVKGALHLTPIAMLASLDLFTTQQKLATLVLIACALVVVGRWIGAYILAISPILQRRFAALQTQVTPLMVIGQPALSLLLFIIVAAWPNEVTQRFIYFQF